jgi:hypothetical protein
MKRQRKGNGPSYTLVEGVAAVYKYGKVDPSCCGQILVEIEGQGVVTRHMVGGRVTLHPKGQEVVAVTGLPGGGA